MINRAKLPFERGPVALLFFYHPLFLLRRALMRITFVTTEDVVTLAKSERPRNIRAAVVSLIVIGLGGVRDSYGRLSGHTFWWVWMVPLSFHVSLSRWLLVKYRPVAWLWFAYFMVGCFACSYFSERLTRWWLGRLYRGIDDSIPPFPPVT